MSIKIRFLSSIIKVYNSAKLVNLGNKVNVISTDPKLNKCKIIRILKLYTDIIPIKVNSRVDKYVKNIASYDLKQNKRYRTISLLRKDIRQKVFTLTFDSTESKDKFIDEVLSL